MMTPRVVGIIQARMGSKRLPGKSMADLAGKPLLWHILQRVKRSEQIDEIVLATTTKPEDDVLIDVAKECGISVFRGSEDDLVDRYYEAAKAYRADIVVRICADNPVIEPEEIDRIILYHRKGESDFSSNTHNIDGNGYPDGLGAEVFGFDKLEELWRTTTDPGYREHPHAYFYEHPEQYRIGTVPCPKSFRRPEFKLDVNTPQELEFIRSLYEYWYPRKRDFHITDIIASSDQARNATTSVPSRALVVVHELTLASIFPIIAAYWKFRQISLHYYRATRAGIWLAKWLARIGLVKALAPIHPPYAYVWLNDVPNVALWDLFRTVCKLCRAQGDQIRELINAALHCKYPAYRAIASPSILKYLQWLLLEVGMLRNYAYSLAMKNNIPLGRVVVVSSYAGLFDRLPPSSDSSAILVAKQAALHNSLFFSFVPLAVAVLRVFSCFRKRPSVLPRIEGVGVAACWGVDRDFSWWRHSGIPSDRLIYMFDRSDFQATTDRVQNAHALGIRSVVLARTAIGESPHLLAGGRQTLDEALHAVLGGVRLTLWSLFSKASRFVLGKVALQDARVAELTNLYRELGLRAVFHYGEAGPDDVALAAESVGAIRVGIHWSCFFGETPATLRTQHVFFLWGRHDAAICLDSGSISKHLLISGCPVNEMRASEQHRQRASEAVSELRRQGARYSLALFDSGEFAPRFYEFFLRWLIEDPLLGLLIKSKTGGWPSVRTDGLWGLIRAALDTGRVSILDDDFCPSDAAMACDFAVGITTPSAVIVSALQGARVCFLDYAGQGQEPDRSYSPLHSLGPNRCVFQNPNTLKHAVLEYMRDPTANPHLGDISPVLDHFDPFRDGKATQRIGEYVRWYLDGLDNGLWRDRALEQATRRYADKWGADKVLRGLM